MKRKWTTDYFSKKLRDFRGPLSVRKFAEIHKIAYSDWNGYETGRKRPSLEKFVELCNLTGIDPSAMLSDTKSRAHLYAVKIRRRS